MEINVHDVSKITSMSIPAVTSVHQSGTAMGMVGVLGLANAGASENGLVKIVRHAFLDCIATTATRHAVLKIHAQDMADALFLDDANV